jgi:hypothetical protein
MKRSNPYDAASSKKMPTRKELLDGTAAEEAKLTAALLTEGSFDEMAGRPIRLPSRTGDLLQSSRD